MTVPVKQLTAASRAKLERHFLKLDSNDLRLRFGVPQNSASLKFYVRRMDFGRDAVFGVFDDELELAGVAHVAVQGQTAELGVSVLPSHRNKGVGSALFERAHAFARNHLIRVLYMHCLSENQAMMHIARKSGMRIQGGGGESDAWLELPLMDAATIASEMFSEQVAVLDYALKAQMKTARSLSEAISKRKS
jgi:RimJ/RimL family protein N-acetyltransferase